MERRKFLKYAAIMAGGALLNSCSAPESGQGIPEFPSDPIKLSLVNCVTVINPDTKLPFTKDEFFEMSFKYDIPKSKSSTPPTDKIFNDGNYSVSWLPTSKEGDQYAILQDAQEKRVFGKLKVSSAEFRKLLSNNISSATVGDYIFIRIGDESNLVSAKFAIDKTKNQLRDVQFESRSDSLIVGVDNKLIVLAIGWGGGQHMSRNPLGGIVKDGSLRYKVVTPYCYTVPISK